MLRHALAQFMNVAANLSHADDLVTARDQRSDARGLSHVFAAAPLHSAASSNAQSQLTKPTTVQAAAAASTRGSLRPGFQVTDRQTQPLVKTVPIAAMVAR